MAIISSTFGGTTLTGKDAEQFIKQINNCKPNDIAKRSLQRGRELRKKMAEQEKVIS